MEQACRTQGFLVGAEQLLFCCEEDLSRTLLDENSRYSCTPSCRHKLFNPQTVALLEGFTGKQWIAGAYTGERPLCQRFIG
ncbi:MAG: hypothetical protein IKA05_02540 [Clostridia bacterium]|nr:hypothetical protein [Clostridia bacterium]